MKRSPKKLNAWDSLLRILYYGLVLKWIILAAVIRVYDRQGDLWTPGRQKEGGKKEECGISFLPRKKRTVFHFSVIQDYSPPHISPNPMHSYII